MNAGHHSISLEELARLRARYYEIIRSYLTGQEMIEVHTPNLYKANAGEPMIEPLTVAIKTGNKSQQRLLVTSPELFHKRLILKGFKSLFEIKTCYRNNEYSPEHSIEFDILEWYRVGAEIEDLQKDIEAMAWELMATGIFKDQWQAPVSISVREAFFQACGFELRPLMTLDDWQWGLKEINVKAPALLKDETDAFSFLYAHKVEPWLKLKSRDPLFLYDYPPYMAGLAKINDAGWASRFEFYWRGLEIANGYDELAEPEEQSSRLRADQAKVSWPVDIGFADELKQGFPKTAGVALGLDRFLMAGLNKRNISEVRLFFQD